MFNHLCATQEDYLENKRSVTITTRGKIMTIQCTEVASYGMQRHTDIKQRHNNSDKTYIKEKSAGIYDDKST